MELQYENYDLISIDIFDTLLFRTVAAESDVFCLVWEYAKSEKITLSDVTAQEFGKLRVEAEQRARNKAVEREVSLEQIYEEFPDFIVRDKDRLQEIELECEKRCCYVNPVIYTVAQKAVGKGVQVILLSDMYLNKIQMTYLLESSGVDMTIFHDIIISCEERVSKNSGKLFQRLQQKYPEISSGRMMHIGDNINSDYRKARENGMSSIHYSVIPQQLDRIYEYERIRHNIPQKAILSLRKLAASYCNEKEKDIYELGAAVAGPFLALYITYVVERLQTLGIHRIYPLMREGYLLGELLKREAAYKQYSLDVHPIYISRKVTYLPSIERINREEIENLIGTRNLTVGEAIRLLHLEEEDFTELKEYFNLPVKETHIRYVDETTVKELLISRLLEPCQVKKAESYICFQRKLLTNYLLQEIGDMSGVATIDVGFFGRIQMWMEKCLDLEKIPHRFKHFLAIGLTGDKISNGIDFDGYYGTFAENMDLITTIHRTTDVLEKMISVTEGSTIGYHTVNNCIVPIKGKSLKQEFFTNTIFDGVYRFQNLWFYFRDRKEKTALDCLKRRRETLMLLHRLIDMPTYYEAEIFSQVKADTNFGTEYEKEVINAQNRQLLEKMGTEYIDRCNISYTWNNNQVVWPKGLITLKDPYYYVRKALSRNTDNEILRSMQEVVSQVKQDGKQGIGLYGAGENGRQFYFICKLFHIEVCCFIDRKESLWGTYKEGIPVMGLEQAKELGCRDFIITSLFSISEIEEYVKESFGKQIETVSIYKV